MERDLVLCLNHGWLRQIVVAVQGADRVAAFAEKLLYSGSNLFMLDDNVGKLF